MDQQTFMPIPHHPYHSSQMETESYDLNDFIEMESMQFVNPHEVHPIIQNVPEQASSGLSQVSSNSNNMLELGAKTQNIKMKMEEFSDLSILFLDTKIDYTDELSTPVFDDKGAFNFMPNTSTTLNENNTDLKVKVEYNAQYYSCDKNIYKDLSLDTDNQVKLKKNYSFSAVGNEQPEMYLYPTYAHSVSYKNNMDDVCSPPDQVLNSFDSKAADNKTSYNINLSVNSNIKYANSSVPSPQDDNYSLISSPGNDQQIDFLIQKDLEHSLEPKPKVNLMIDQNKYAMKNENPSILNTPDVIDEVVNMGTEFNILDLVNNDDITFLSANDELVLSLTSPSTASISPSTPSTTLSPQPSPTKRSRRRKSSNYDDDSDHDYVPPNKKRRSTVRLADIDIAASNSSDNSDYDEMKPIKKSKSSKPRGRPPKRADSVSSDGSKDPNLSKYRELRDKNNEASRKSRLKRRIKELEYEQEAEQLLNKNIRLKAQVEELEKMVSTFRNNLFKILVNK